MPMNSPSFNRCAGDHHAVENPAEQYLFPKNSCDTHFHVFGHSDEFPLIAERAYTPAIASMADYWKTFRPLGVEKCVLVQPSVYGRDHGLLRKTLRQADAGRMRGVAVIHEDTPDAEIEELHALGVRGARCNALFPGGVSVSSLQAVADRIRGLGWHMQLLVNVDDDPDLVPRVADMGVAVVVDHFGHPSRQLGAGGPGSRNLQALMKEGRAWVKFSGAYRISETASAVDPAVVPIAHALVQANPHRIVWGSDWPHPGINAHSHSGIELAQALMEWVPEEYRQAVLVENPAVLYWGH
ncbi:MAG: amidohydrolase family protein [Delftia acidovorans]|nr:amidohydrolase family protein [Delftia acidovorans]